MEAFLLLLFNHLSSAFFWLLILRLLPPITLAALLFNSVSSILLLADCVEAQLGRFNTRLKVGFLELADWLRKQDAIPCQYKSRLWLPLSVFP